MNLDLVKKSIKEQCLTNIEITLKSITLLNGYDIEIDSVQRFNVEGQLTTPKTLIIIIQDDVEFVKESNPYVIKRVFVDLHVSVIQDENETMSGDAIMNIYEANIGKALQAAPDRAGYALDTGVLAVTALSIPNGQRRLEAIMRFSIDYQHHREDHTAI